MTETRHGVADAELDLDGFVEEMASWKQSMWKDFDEAIEKAAAELTDPDAIAVLRRNADRTKERWSWTGKDWPKPNPGQNPKKLAIVGFAQTRLCAPYGEEGYELWGLNDPHDAPGFPARHAFTRWFQLHPPHYLRKHYPAGIKDLARNWGEPKGIRLYMDRHYDEYPDSVPYPKAEVEALTRHGFFHASSFDWMLALGILDGFEEIELYGCQFYAFPVTNREPISALACLSYWCGVAEGRGIKVTQFGDGHLFKIIHMATYESQLQYGFEREPALDLGTDADPRWKDVR